MHAICMAHSMKKGIGDALHPKSPSQAVKEGITDESDTDDEEYDQDGNANNKWISNWKLMTIVV